MAYAEKTEVPVERTRAEIERLLVKHKCSAYITGSDSQTRQAMVQFRAHDRIIRFLVQLPKDDDKAFRGRMPSARERLFAQAERQRWRALMLVIKAKLESVESKIATFEEEFLAHIVMPNDRTVGQMVTPLIARAYESGQMPQRLLPGVAEEADVVEGTLP